MKQNGFSGQAKLKSVLVVVLLVFTAFFAVASTMMPAVRGYATPGTGVFWTMDDLVANSGGAVTGGGGVYQVHEDVTISRAIGIDYLIMRDGEVVSIDARFGIYVEGVLFSYGFVAPIEFNSNEPVPEAQDWIGITFNRGSTGRFANTMIRHADTGIRINDGDVWVAYSRIQECYPYGIYYNSGTFQLNSSFVLGSSPPSASVTNNGGTGVYATGLVSDILWLNESWIIGGNGNPSGPGGPAVFALNVDGPIGVIGNTLIVGGTGGYNSIDGGMAGGGGLGMHFFPIFDTVAPRGLTISNNFIIAGGEGGLNNASLDGMSGIGGDALMITDDNSQGTVLISNNSLIFGGSGGLNLANWSAGFMVGNGGSGISMGNIGGLASALWNNSLILGGQGGNNTGATIMPGATAGYGGNAVQLMNSRDFVVETNIIIGGHGGNNTWPGFGANGGMGGIGLWMGSSMNITVNDTMIFGGEGGDDWVGMVGPGMMSGPGNGFHAITTMDTMGSVTNCYVQGGEGGDNFGSFGEGRPGGYAVNLMGPGSPFFSDSTFIGGKGGDNYNDSGFMSGAGNLAFYISGGMRSSIVFSDIIGGAGGNAYAGANAVPREGSGAIFILGSSRMVTVSDNPIITVGAGGTNFVTAAVGPKGSTVVQVGSNARRITLSRNLIYNGSQYGVFNQAPGLLVDGNWIQSNAIGINLEPTARWTNITNNVRIGNGQEGVRALDTRYLLVGNNLIENMDTGIMLTNTTDVLIDRTTVNNTMSAGIVMTTGSERVLVENSTIMNSNLDAFGVYRSNGTTLNTTFTGLVDVMLGSNLTVKNYLDAKVIDTVMAPIPNADVEVLDNGAQVYATPGYGGGNVTTDVSGEVNWIIVTDRIYIGSGVATENITVANVSEGARIFINNPRGVDMSFSHQEVFAEFLGLDFIPPEIYNVYLNGMKFVNVLAGTPVDITAVLDDTLTGNSNITLANYTIGQDVWLTSTPMNPTDGAFDGPVESADETIDTTLMIPGSYQIWVYGCDDQMNCNVTGDFATLNITTDTVPPEIRNVLVNGLSAVTVVQGTMVSITARVNDELTGNSDIRDANYTIGQDIWPTSTPMNPTDGTFDSPSEAVDEMIDTAGWIPGSYEIWVYGCDIVPNCNITGNFATINIVLESEPPEIYGVTVNQLPLVNVPAGTLVTLNATLDDTLTGGSNIGMANFTRGMANWPGTNMIPMDGAYDGVVEDVTYVVDTTGWGCGLNDMYVYGEDVIPNYNTTSVAYATINITVCDFEPPEIYNVNVDGAPTQTYYLSLLPATFLLTADIDDEATGGTPIGGANYTIPIDNWPSSTPMNPTDGTFDTRFEAVDITIATPTVPGVYEYCVYGWDQVVPPNYNTTGSCAYLTIADDLGPDVTNVLIDGSPSAIVVIGAVVVLTATADDTLRGNSDIQTVNYTIGPQNWISSTPMNPVDGAFDNPMEDATVNIDTALLGLGTYTFCVNAMDELLNENNACTEFATLDVTSVDNLPPEISNTLADGQDPRIATAGMILVLTATVNDFPTGGSDIAFANYTIGPGNWVSSTPMSAQDAAFDSPSEDVIALVNTAGWTVGPYDVCVYGGDVAFNNNTTSTECVRINIVIDTLPPYAMGTPTGTGVAIDTNIVLDFNEPMNTDTANASFSYTDLISIFNETNGIITWSNGNRTMTFNPGSDFAYSTTYIVTLNGSIAEDVVGNPLDGNRDGTGGDDYVFYFKTADAPPVVDDIPPIVISTDPTDDAPDVPVTTRIISVTFNESMNEDEGDVTVDGIGTTESWDGNTLIITLESDMDYDTTYQVRIRNAEDEAGNPLGEHTFTFTTETEPVTPPPPTEAGFDWLWLLVIVLVIIIIIMALLLLRKKKPEEVLVTPMAEEEVEAVMPTEEALPPPEDEEPYSEEEEVFDEEAEAAPREEGEFLEDADT